MVAEGSGDKHHMSKTYPELPETNFPDSLDVFDRLSDVTSGDIILVNQYQAYMSAGNQAAAAKLLTDNPDLKNKIINASILEPISLDRKSVV